MVEVFKKGNWHMQAAHNALGMEIIICPKHKLTVLHNLNVNDLVDHPGLRQHLIEYGANGIRFEGHDHEVEACVG